VDGKKIHLELLLSHRVLDQAGKPIGRIEEVYAQQENDEIIVKEYLMGPYGLLERLSVLVKAEAILHWLGIGNPRRCQIPWDKLDLRNPQKLKLLCDIAELNDYQSTKNRRRRN
jgi:hypothetical protein